jgi:hypothetical protein
MQYIQYLNKDYNSLTAHCSTDVNDTQARNQFSSTYLMTTQSGAERKLKIYPVKNLVALSI